MEEARNIIRDMLRYREVVNLINNAGDELNFESLANYIKLVCEEGRLQEVIKILSVVGSKFFPSRWFKNSCSVKDIKQQVVGTFSRTAERKVYASGLMISEVPRNSSQLVEDGILEKKQRLYQNNCLSSVMNEYHFLCQNSLNYDFETYYSVIAALCSKGELQKAHDIVKFTFLGITKNH